MEEIKTGDKVKIKGIDSIGEVTDIRKERKRGWAITIYTVKLETGQEFEYDRSEIRPLRSL